MEGFSKNDLTVNPRVPRLTCREADLAFVCLLIENLEEHVPSTISLNHERIRDKLSWYVAYVPAS